MRSKNVCINIQGVRDKVFFPDAIPQPVSLFAPALRDNNLALLIDNRCTTKRGKVRTDSIPLMGETELLDHGGVKGGIACILAKRVNGHSFSDLGNSLPIPLNLLAIECVLLSVFCRGILQASLIEQ